MDETVSFATVSGRAQGVLAAGTPGPGVLLLPDFQNLTPALVAAAERLARNGFPTLILDLLGSQGDGGFGSDEYYPSQFYARDLAVVADDLNGAAWFLLHHPLVTGTAVCAAGAGDGAAVALWAAAISPRIRAVSAAYPARNLWRSEGIQPGGMEGCHTILHLADDDTEFSQADAEQLRAALSRGGAQLAIHSYPGTRRWFLDETRPDLYNPEAAAQVWERTMAAARTAARAQPASGAPTA